MHFYDRFFKIIFSIVAGVSSWCTYTDINILFLSIQLTYTLWRSTVLFYFFEVTLVWLLLKQQKTAGCGNNSKLLSVLDAKLLPEKWALAEIPHKAQLRCSPAPSFINLVSIVLTQGWCQWCKRNYRLQGIGWNPRWAHFLHGSNRGKLNDLFKVTEDISGRAGNKQVTLYKTGSSSNGKTTWQGSEIW